MTGVQTCALPIFDCILAGNRGKPVVCYDPVVGRASSPFLTYCCVSDSGLDLPGCAATFYTMPNNLIADPRFCDTAANDFRLQATSPCVGIASDAGNIGAEEIGCFPLDVDDTENPPLPNGMTLEQNFPNPFNPTTEISFSLPAAADVRLTVYNVRGQQVAVLADGPFGPGRHTITWEAVDESGAPLSSGVYFYRITTHSHSLSRKMLLLK